MLLIFLAEDPWHLPRLEEPLGQCARVRRRGLHHPQPGELCRESRFLPAEGKLQVEEISAEQQQPKPRPFFQDGLPLQREPFLHQDCGADDVQAQIRRHQRGISSEMITK